MHRLKGCELEGEINGSFVESFVYACIHMEFESTVPQWRVVIRYVQLSIIYNYYCNTDMEI